MTKKAVQNIESIGFEWRLSTERKAIPSCEKNGHSDNRRDETYNKLCYIKEDTEHCCVPHIHPVLGFGVKRQKIMYEHLLGKGAMDDTAEDKDGNERSLAEERIRKLIEIGFFEAISTNKQKHDRIKKRFLIAEMTSFGNGTIAYIVRI